MDDLIERCLTDLEQAAPGYRVTCDWHVTAIRNYVALAAAGRMPNGWEQAHRLLDSLKDFHNVDPIVPGAPLAAFRLPQDIITNLEKAGYNNAASLCFGLRDLNSVKGLGAKSRDVVFATVYRLWQANLLSDGLAPTVAAWFSRENPPKVS